MSAANPELLGNVFLRKFFEKGAKVKYFQLTQGGTVNAQVPDGKQWIIIGGYFGHITGTTSLLQASRQAAGTGALNVNYVPSGQANGTYPIFNNIPAAAADTTGSAAVHPLMAYPAGTWFFFSGGAGAAVAVIVLESDAF